MSCPVLIITRQHGDADVTASSVVHVFPSDHAVDLAIASAEKVEATIQNYSYSKRIDIVFVRLYDQEQQQKVDATIAANT